MSSVGTNPFWNHMHIEEIVSDNGYSEIKCNVFPGLFNFSGNVHGGAIATLVDASIGKALRSTLNSDQNSATVDLNIKYLLPAKGGTLVAKARLSRKGKTLAVGTSEVYDDNDRLVAIGSGTFIIMKKE